MPQVLALITPEVQDNLLPLLDEVGQTLITITERIFQIEGEGDVAFTALPALCTINEAPLQIEIKYTAGDYEYGRDKPFEPSKTQKQALIKAIAVYTEGRLGNFIESVSIFVIPIKGASFTLRTFKKT
jgi:hypothetical protein